MLDTKEKILYAALRLFNSKGVTDTTLRDIAAEVEISSGNLAYHFKNKDYIIEALYDRMENERDRLLAEVQAIPSFENIHKQTGKMLHLKRKYQFFFLDSLQLIRTFPKLADLQRKYIDDHIAYIKAMIDYSVGSGNMKAETVTGMYRQLAHTVWMVLYFWMMQQRIRGDEEAHMNEVSQTMWYLVWPHLTEKGRHNFLQVFEADPALKNKFAYTS